MNWKLRLILVILGLTTIGYGMSLIGRGSSASMKVGYRQVMFPGCMVAAGAALTALSALPSKRWMSRRTLTQRKYRSFSEQKQKTPKERITRKVS